MGLVALHYHWCKTETIEVKRYLYLNWQKWEESEVWNLNDTKQCFEWTLFSSNYMWYVCYLTEAWEGVMSKEIKYVDSSLSVIELTGEEQKITYIMHITVAVIAYATYIFTYNSLSQKQHLIFVIWRVLDRKVTHLEINYPYKLIWALLRNRKQTKH